MRRASVGLALGLAIVVALGGWALFPQVAGDPPGDTGAPSPAREQPRDAVPPDLVATPRLDPTRQTLAYGVMGWESNKISPEGTLEPGRLSESDLSRMAADGVGYLRVPLRPSEQFADGDWITHYDGLIRSAARRGVAVLPWLEGGLSGPAADQTSTANPPNSAPELRRFEETARLAAARWGPEGSLWRELGCPGPDCDDAYLPIRAWEVWNEPNNSRFWRSRVTENGTGGADPEEYAAALVAARSGFRRADPEARVVSAGLANRKITRAGPDRGQGIEMLEFQERLQESAGGCALDAAAMHFYDSAGSPQELRERARDFRVRVDAGGATGAPLWITELGAASFSRDGRSTPAKQAEFIAESLDLLRADRARLELGPVFAFMWKDNAEQRDLAGRPAGDRAGDTYNRNAGLHDYRGALDGWPATRKPALAAFTRRARRQQPLPLPPVRHCPGERR